MSAKVTGFAKPEDAGFGASPYLALASRAQFGGTFLLLELDHCSNIHCLVSFLNPSYSPLFKMGGGGKIPYVLLFN